MAKASVPLTSLSEEQRAEAYARFELLRPVLEEGVSQAHIVRTHQLSNMRITRGNLRLIDRLMLQVEHVLLANKLQVVTKEVVETAGENLIIGPG